MGLNVTKLVLAMRLLMSSLVFALHHIGVAFTISSGTSGRSVLSTLVFGKAWLLYSFWLEEALSETIWAVFQKYLSPPEKMTKCDFVGLVLECQRGL